MIGTLASGANASLVAKNGTKKIIALLYHEYNSSIYGTKTHFKQNEVDNTKNQIFQNSIYGGNK